jgi:hypothetical protein
MCRKFTKCAIKIRNLHITQLPSIILLHLLVLHFGDINKGDSGTMGIIFNNVYIYIYSLVFADKIEDVILGAVT